MTWKAALLSLFVLVFATATATAQCSLTISPLTFGTYVGAQLDNTTTGRVTCTGAWSVALDAGTGAGATVANRLMTGPGGVTLAYTLYLDAARSTVWGAAPNNLTGTGNTNITVYGRVFTGQFPTPGTYTDTVHSATTSFTITATVQPNCTVSATSMAFGIYTGAQVNSTSVITATCTNSTPYNVGLNAGTSSGATVTTRAMTGPAGAKLNYSLFRNSGYTQNWGNTVGTDTVPGSGAGGAQSLTVYGRISASQYATPGAYSDTITVTLTY